MEKKPGAVQGCITFIVIIIVVAVVFNACLDSCGSKNKSSPSDNVTGAWAYAQLFVERSLKAPSTAKFPFGGAHRDVKYLGNDEYEVNSYVDSQNSFGAMIRTKFKLIIKELKAENKWQLIGNIEFIE